MRKFIEWTALILLGMLTLFQALTQGAAQFGFDFVQGGPEPLELQLGWFALACQLLGLGISRRTGVLLIVAGLIDWVFFVIILQMRSRHSLKTAILSSVLQVSYVLLAVLYTVAARRWRWTSPADARKNGALRNAS